MGAETSPQYLRIALDIASQIADGDLEEGRCISGRSLLASSYGVSPETIRRALRLLADMKAVEVRDKRGVVILSQDNARRYLQSFAGRSEKQDLHAKLKELSDQSQELSRRMLELCARILGERERPFAAGEALPNYEVRVLEHSPLIGKSIGALHFWQQTGATIVAIRRKQSVILSPGPYAELYGGDVILFVGTEAAADAVESFVNAQGEN